MIKSRRMYQEGKGKPPLESMPADLLILAGFGLSAVFLWRVSPWISLVLVALALLAIVMRWLQDR